MEARIVAFFSAMRTPTTVASSTVCYNKDAISNPVSKAARAVSNEHLHQLSLNEIIVQCRAEAQQQRQQEVGYCLELFRRALEARDQAAWNAIATQYRPFMLGWVYAYKSITFTPDEADDIVREAIERFWRTLTRRSVNIAAHFGHVGALLKYLNQCVIATILDQQRKAQRTARLVERLQTGAAEASVQPSPEEMILEEADRAAKVQQVRDWVQRHVTDPQEQRLLYLSYERELTPAQIAQQYPDEFTDAQTVRRLKERILKRARRVLTELDSKPAHEMASDQQHVR